MKRLILLGLVILAAVAIAEESAENEGLALAEACDPETCKLPECRCMSTETPSGLRSRDVPQFVTLTFDDAINIVNIETYREILYNRKNPNQCNIGATFYVSHEYTNYQLVNELYQRGFEIGLHSITHRTPQTWWASASYEDLKKELVDQRKQISHFANIPQSAIQGLRMPFLQLSGNTTFQLLKENDMLYDCSWPTTNFNNPPLWPYTLNYASQQDCHIGPCPTASFPGLWVQPMVSWVDLEGFPCSMADACVNTPDREGDVESWYNFFVKNFERHYLGNRAPFPFYLHEGYISAATSPVVREAYSRLLNLFNSLPDVYIVNSAEVVEWMKNPVPVNEYVSKPCRTFANSPCIPRNCGSYTHGTTTYWFSVCNVCPNVYPWFGNALGE